jgi:hypothetical protein
MSDSREPVSERSVREVPEPPTSRDGAAARPDAVLASPDPRILAAWREWLRALASDADAALAAADLYSGLEPDARDAWLDALAEDAPGLSVPLVAIYAPLLAVEAEPDRRARMEAEIALCDPSAFRGRPVRALSAIAPGGARVVALIQPVYLRFVRVLWCRFSPDEGVFWARHDSLVSEADAPRSGTVVDGLSLEPTPLPPVVEELAHAILAHRRRGAELPSSLREFADLFDTDVEAIDGLV